MTTLAPTLQAFFTDRLIAQRRASTCTIASYRDTLRLLLQYAQQQTGTAPSQLDIGQLDADLISRFLDHLEHDRNSAIGTRNTRLAAIRSLFTYATLRHPEHAASIARVLAIPPKRHDRTIITHLTKPEIKALLTAPDTNTWIGRRDHTMIQLDIETGLRVSELTALTIADTHLGTGAHVACHGKGGICCAQHIRSYVALGTMLRSVECERGLRGIGLVGATYFGRVDDSRATLTCALVAAAAGLAIRRRHAIGRASLEFHADVDVLVGRVERRAAEQRCDRRDGKPAQNMLRSRLGDRNRRPLQSAPSAHKRRDPPSRSRTRRNIVLDAT